MGPNSIYLDDDEKKERDDLTYKVKQIIKKKGLGLQLVAREMDMAYGTFCRFLKNPDTRYRMRYATVAKVEKWINDNE